MAWRLTGQLIETCSCNMFCPCWFTVQDLMIMDQGWCASAIAFRTREGNSDRNRVIREATGADYARKS